MSTGRVLAVVGYANIAGGGLIRRARQSQRLFIHHQHGIAPLFMVESAMLALICQRLAISVSFKLSDVLQRERIGQR